jgi:bifunctional UDP-N-acetylglucosamine pyrophosphorylase / glucosamine-1-phosphate N-acetyltransferase
MSQAFTAIVLAAGEGTRMHSSRPKALHDLCGRPLVCWPIQAALAAGANRVVVVDSPARALEGVLPEGVSSVVQERPNGTGGAVLAAAPQIAADAPVVVLSGDVPLVSAELLGTLLEGHEGGPAQATILSTVLTDPSGYGRVVRDAEGYVERIAETKTAGDASEQELAIAEINAGVYVFDGSSLLAVIGALSPENAQGELYVTEALEKIRTSGGKVAALGVDDFRVALGVNDRVQLAAARALAQRAINERHMRAGVTIVDPDCAYIDVDVAIGEDTTVEPDTRLLGATVVGAGARVGPQTTAIDSQIGDGALVRASWLDRAVVHAGVTVGPFTHLRPGTLLHAGAKAGAFVEIKNSDIGRGAKVPHLSYIGDAEVGEEANLGAATITANYDGRAKHRTTIGRRVHSGVDTTFVAPVSVGDDAVTGAGSVLTEDVPAGALAVARARQVNIDDYAKRRKDGTGDERAGE